MMMMTMHCVMSCVIVTVQLQGYTAERKGEREEMQDAHVVIDDFSTFLHTDAQ